MKSFRFRRKSQIKIATLIKQAGDALGIVCRRRTRMAAKSVGELPRSIDPAVSEWGNPFRSNTVDPVARQEGYLPN